MIKTLIAFVGFAIGFAILIQLYRDMTGKEKWDAVSNARPMMAKLFGNNYKEIDNSMDLRDESIPLEQRDATVKVVREHFANNLPIHIQRL